MHDTWLFNVQERNPFLVVSFMIIPVVICIFVWGGRRTKLKSAAIGVLCGCLGGALALEGYWNRMCPTNPRVFEETKQILAANANFLAVSPEGAAYRERCWSSDGTGLFVGRNDPGIGVWEQDSDFSVVMVEGEKVSDAFSDMKVALSKFYERAVTEGLVDGPVKFRTHDDRWLMQVMGPKGGHGDFWFWEPRTHPKYPGGIVFNPDSDFATNLVPEGGQGHLRKWCVYATVQKSTI